MILNFLIISIFILPLINSIEIPPCFSITTISLNLNETKEFELDCPTEEFAHINITLGHDSKLGLDGNLYNNGKLYDKNLFCEVSKFATDVRLLKICKINCKYQYCIPLCCTNEVTNSDQCKINDELDLQNLFLNSSQNVISIIPPENFHKYCKDFVNIEVDSENPQPVDITNCGNIIKFRPELKEEGIEFTFLNEKLTKYLTFDEFCVKNVSKNRQKFELKVCREFFELYDCQSLIEYVSYYSYLSSNYIAAIVLTITVIIYLIIFSKLNFFEWMMFAFAFSMLILYYVLIFERVFQIENGSISNKICGVIFMFTSHSGFTWLTLLSFNMFLTFKKIQNRSIGESILKRFAKYSIFGFGIPLLLIILSYTIFPDCTIINKVTNETSCKIRIRYTDKFDPVNDIFPILTLILNCVFFGLTLWNIYKTKKVSEMAQENIKQRNKSFRITSRLFLVCGISWIFIFIRPYPNDPLKKYIISGFVFASVNMVQSIGVFWIFICKKSVGKNLLGNKHIKIFWDCLNMPLKLVREENSIKLTESSVITITN